MSDINADVSMLESEAVSHALESATAGQLIREARLASGIHIGALSLALKVSVKKLEALEANNWTQFADAVFVRALASSVCRHIKVNSGPILAALPQRTSHGVLSERMKIDNKPILQDASMGKWRKASLALSIPLLSGALILLLGALVLIFLPNFIKQQNSPKAVVIEKIEPVAAPVFAQALAPIAPEPVATELPSLSLVAKGSVWVQIKDAKAAVLLFRHLQPKEVVNITGEPPLSVVIGNTREIESILVRGQPFNLAPVTIESVARFEVK